MSRRRSQSSSSEESSDSSSDSTSSRSTDESTTATSNTRTTGTSRTNTNSNTTSSTRRTGDTTTSGPTNTTTTTTSGTRTGTTAPSSSSGGGNSKSDRRVAFRRNEDSSSSSGSEDSSSSSGSSSSGDDSSDGDSDSTTETRTTTTATTTTVGGSPNMRTRTAGASSSSSKTGSDSSSSSGSGSSDSSDDEDSTTTGTTATSTRTGTTSRSHTTSGTRSSATTTRTGTSGTTSTSRTTGTSSTSNTKSTTSGTSTGASTTGTTTTTGTSTSGTTTTTDTSRTATGTTKTDTGTSRTEITTSATTTPRGNGRGPRSKSSSSSTSSSSSSDDSSTNGTETTTSSRTTTGSTTSTTTSKSTSRRRKSLDSSSVSGSTSSSRATRRRPEDFTKSLGEHIAKTTASANGGQQQKPLVVPIPGAPARALSISSVSPQTPKGGSPSTTPLLDKGKSGDASVPPEFKRTTASAANPSANPTARSQTDVDVANAIAVASAAVVTATAVNTLEVSKSPTKGAFSVQQDELDDSRRFSGRDERRYDGEDASSVLNKSGSTIGTVDMNRTDAYLSPDRDREGLGSSPSKLVPTVTLAERVVRPQIGLAAERTDAPRERLNVAYMIRYRSSQDSVHSFLSKMGAAQLEVEEAALVPETDKTPEGCLSAINARAALRAFGWSDASVKEADKALGRHTHIVELQGMIEKENLSIIPKLFKKKFLAIDPHLSGEIEQRECNRLLINCKIGAAAIGPAAAPKVVVHLALFRGSLGVSVQQYSDAAEFFNLGSEANFQLSYQTNNDVIINSSYIITGLTAEERDGVLQALHACSHIRAAVDAATMEDGFVCYEPLMSNLLAHPKGWMAATAITKETKSIFRERLVVSLIAPSSKLKELGGVKVGGAEDENAHQDPFLFSTLLTQAQRQDNFMPRLQPRDCALERPVGDSSRVFATIKFSEIRLPDEKIPFRCPFYVMVSLISESGEIQSAARLYAIPQKKPSNIWTFPKDVDSLLVYGTPTDLLYVEICYSTAQGESESRESIVSLGKKLLLDDSSGGAEDSVSTLLSQQITLATSTSSGLSHSLGGSSSKTEHSCGFSSARLDGLEDGVTAMVVHGGTIYERTARGPRGKQQSGEGGEKVKSGGLFSCEPKVVSTRILAEISVGRGVAGKGYAKSQNQLPVSENLPSRFVIDPRHVELLALCREAIYDRLERKKVSGVPHVLNLQRDHVVRQALSVTEDSSTLGILSLAWNSLYKKFEREQKADLNFVYHQLWTLLLKVAAAKNLVVNSEEILKIVKAEAQILLQSGAPLKPVAV